MQLNARWCLSIKNQLTRFLTYLLQLQCLFLSQIWVPPSALNPTKNLKGGKIIIPNLASDVKLTTHSISVDGILNQKTWCFSFDDG